MDVAIFFSLLVDLLVIQEDALKSRKPLVESESKWASESERRRKMAIPFGLFTGNANIHLALLIREVSSYFT